MTRSDHSDRRVAERVERLRSRLKGMKAPLTVDDVSELLGVVKGMLDLLMDEL